MQKMLVFKWKLKITMDFVVDLASTLGKFDIIWVITNLFTKSTYFVPTKVNYNVETRDVGKDLHLIDFSVAWYFCLHYF